METKERVGEFLKGAAKWIPGIGSYQDKEAVREADKALRESIVKKLDELLGAVEWLKTDQGRKGAYKHLKAMEDLGEDLEKLSRLIETSARGYAPLFDQWRADQESLVRLYRHDLGIWDLVAEIEYEVEKITAERAMPKSREIEEIRLLLKRLEMMVSDREQFFKE
ncbi:MAG TPA: hypothetical protein EYP06_06475 [Desulfobacterales bacterium]|nr:hypothetical protein [Desulfobacterales bacterium]